MVEIPYIEYDTDDMILRDFLALHRSQLANERTILAYARTALALSGGGITFIKLFPDTVFEIVGWFLIPLGIIIASIGVYRFLSVRAQFNDLDNDRQPIDLQYEEDDGEYADYETPTAD